MKRIMAIILCVVLIFSVSACRTDIKKNENKIRVVTTIFPIYDWVRNIAAGIDEVEISMLAQNGGDLHSFQPTVEDIVMISNCDIFIYVGGESDKWVDVALKESNNKKRVAINLLDKLGDSKLKEELKEGMQGKEEGEETEDDEHIWLSLKNAEVLSNAICDGFLSVDAKNRNAYKANRDEYVKKLDEIDKEYFEIVSSGSQSTLVFGDRFPFRYMIEDYNIDYYAAFIGCSAESEASFKTVMFLANKIDDLGLKTIIKIESSDGALAEAIRDNTKLKNAEILTLNSMQSITAKDVLSGITYLGICRDNLKVLRKALK